MNFEKWLVDNGAQFPHVELCSMGENVIFIAVVDCLDERSVYEGYRAKRNSNSDNSLSLIHIFSIPSLLIHLLLLLEVFLSIS